jgi:hypothetical protein
MALLALVVAGCGGGGDDGGTPTPSNQIPFEHYDAGFFSIDKPQGWTVTTAGACGTFAFLIRNPQDPRWQIFYFGTVGPVYMSQAQKDFDIWYVNNGGFNVITWLDAPVIDPLTPQNYLAHWPEIADMQAAAAFMTQFPHLHDLTLIASAGQTAMLPGGTTANARGLFTLNGEVCEGMFLATVKQFMPCTGTLNPGQCNAYGHFVCGVTAPKTEFAGVVARLIESLDSFTVTQSYVDNCLTQSQQLWGAVAEAGRTLSEASDIIFDGWLQRTHSEDISAEQWTDTYRGVERIYDPTTGEVYEVPIGWYDDYNLHRNEYDMSGLQLLPSDNWDLWMRAVLDGLNRIH